MGEHLEMKGCAGVRVYPTSCTIDIVICQVGLSSYDSQLFFVRYIIKYSGQIV